ncbi:MAG: protein disulfide oxidoreductase [Proteobacteria bacterium]|nr:MAG: protein disulfide oxidoreductase [Pseudomonadota bacterium]
MNRKRKSSRKRRWGVWGLELVVIIAVVFGVRAWQQRTLIDGVAPAFDEMSLAGKAIVLEDFKGRPVMLHFWSDWCSVCELEQLGINKIIEKWPVITVAYSSGEADEVQRYLEKRKLTHWTVLVDNDGDLAKLYGVNGVPTTFVIDADGNIRFREVGLSSSWGLRLRLWLAERL